MRMDRQRSAEPATGRGVIELGLVRSSPGDRVVTTVPIGGLVPDPKAQGHTVLQVVVAVLAALAVVALLAYARGEPGVDGRAPDPEDAAAAEPLPGQAG
jgi:hypothetical protein